ncbi:MAG: acetylxylan esterase [Pirellulaceae bacterium]|nr:acetylxylan esterase [Pirellulaceae bacterium]
MYAKRLLTILLLVGLVAELVVASLASASDSVPGGVDARFTGPWDLRHLKQPPRFVWGETRDGVREVYYENEPYRGQATRVFAYFAKPADGEGPFPGMVLVHGGGGTAFAEWARLWAERGYAALAMDLAGRGPDRDRLADGGPDQSDTEKFGPFDEHSIRDVWSYHAVAAVIRGHSLLASLPEVDGSRTGVTGISWGGYLTCIVAGLDDRFKAAVPVYGCGFLHENSVWLPRLAGMESAQRTRWVDNFDPSRYLPGVNCPILFVNGTNDFAYPLDSYRKSYRAVSGTRQLCVTVRMPHSHPAGWKPIEIDLFIDSVVRDGTPLPRLGPPGVEDGELSAAVESKTPIKSAEIHYTADTGAWQQREWHSRDATLKAGRVSAPLPQERPCVAFLTVTDERGATISTEHVECEP